MKYMTEVEREGFWERHEKSHRELLERFDNLPYIEWLAYKYKLWEVGDAMRNAKRVK